uniref:Uncharacterized protein n=1 Tax=Cacopsylla melanoneura TaxID=428564 RepID=A0A8D8YGP4_9HEMI
MTTRILFKVTRSEYVHLIQLFIRKVIKESKIIRTNGKEFTIEIHYTIGRVLLATRLKPVESIVSVIKIENNTPSQNPFQPFHGFLIPSRNPFHPLYQKRNKKTSK